MLLTALSLKTVKHIWTGRWSKKSILVSVADAPTVNPNDIKMLLANDLSTFSLKVNQFLVQDVYKDIPLNYFRQLNF